MVKESTARFFPLYLFLIHEYPNTRECRLAELRRAVDDKNFPDGALVNGPSYSIAVQSLSAHCGFSDGSVPRRPNAIPGRRL